MDIEQLVTLVTRQVKERLEGFEKRRKVLLLGTCDNYGEELHEMFESRGFSLCDIENYKSEQSLEAYEFVLIPKAKFGEMLQKAEVCAGSTDKDENCCSPAVGSQQNDPGKVCWVDRRIISEQDIQKLVREGCREIIAGRRTVITPLALDTAKVWGVRIVKE
jgi:hypothetical protein